MRGSVGNFLSGSILTENNFVKLLDVYAGNGNRGKGKTERPAMNPGKIARGGEPSAEDENIFYKTI